MLVKDMFNKLFKSFPQVLLNIFEVVEIIIIENSKKVFLLLLVINLKLLNNESLEQSISKLIIKWWCSLGFKWSRPMELGFLVIYYS